MTALRDAMFVGSVTVAAAITDPLRYRSGWMLILLVAAGSATGATWALATGRVSWPYAVAGALAGLVVWLVLLLVATLLVEWSSFARATVVFRHRDGRSRAVARVAPSRRTAETWRVSSVAAWPRGRGGGTAVMAQLIEEADRRGLALELTPSTARVRAWYEGLGFTAAHESVLTRAPVDAPSSGV